jgi:uncharacterized protein YhdP
VGTPGIAGLTLDFDFNQTGGQAELLLQDGAVDLPGGFEDPLVRVGQLSGQVKWQVDGERIAVHLSAEPEVQQRRRAG